MAQLDLYKDRRHSVIKLSDGKSYKIPNEYTVEEAERILELRSQQEALESEQVDDSKKEMQLKRFWSLIFDQLEVIFQHYQSDVDAAYLRKHVTQNEALEMLGFFEKYRHAALAKMRKEASDDTQSEESKKKLN